MRFALTLAALMSAGLVQPVTAQYSHDLTLAPGVRLLTPEGGLLPGPVSDVAASSDGFIVSTHTHLGLLEATGSALTTRRMTAGAGDDSHPHPRAVDRHPGGTLVWHDAEMNALMGVPANRTLPIVWAEVRFQPISVIALDDSTMVVSGSDRTPQGFGYPLHAWRPGRRLASFGAPPDATVGSFEGGAEPLVLAPANAGGFWAASVFEPRIVQYSAEREQIHTIEFDAPWLTRGGGTGTPDTPPGTSLLDMVETPEGHLWIIAQIPDPAWQDAWQGVELNPMGAVNPLLLNRRKLFDTVVMVIDPVTGETLATTTMDDVVVAIAPGNQLVTMDRIDQYHADVRVLRASLSLRRIDP